MALFGPSRGTTRCKLPPEGLALLLLERLIPSLVSSCDGEFRYIPWAVLDDGDGCGAGACPFPFIGEYGRGVDDGENEETWSRITNSSVALVSLTILLRKVDDTDCAPLLLPRFLMTFESWTTVYNWSAKNHERLSQK